MLEIRSCNDPAKYSDFIRHHVLKEESWKILEAIDCENVIGFCVYACTADILKIFAVECKDDLLLYDGLIRSALFKASGFGIDRVEFFLADLNIVKKLGFLKNESNYSASIQNFIKGCKNCK